jgi:ATP-dependent DNA helicase RecQ
LLPTPPDADRRLRHLLAETRAENGRRLKSIVEYLEARTCRHVMLAAHFGERLPACADSCDVCAARQRRGVGRAPEPEPAEPPARKAGAATAADALTALTAAKTLPFAVGKTGLTRLLQGSISSAIKEDRSRQFGALAHLPASRVEALIERLIAAGYLHRDEEHEYRLLSITPLGRDATEADLAAVADPLPAPKPAGSASSARSAGGRSGRSSSSDRVETEIDMDQWDAEQHALFERLRRWRYEQASAAAMPAYVIMPNEALVHLVARQPRSLADLAGVKGFGPARVQRYGEAVLRLIATTTAD